MTITEAVSTPRIMVNNRIFDGAFIKAYKSMELIEK